ncbi:tRNA pseudouridine(55) synthase TruB [Leadbettera azotonutricia]|uniref:tRNA pseudouridine synthase B n=1 Tax=Leadbettera azotonutricia (strain ATCC BAA-888 / DSM 13862 / ZAS-9) TaxID=545695 RepID=F5YBN3_LEAAZ|nr:tRNA pseudouridine(55) synthase TruB [Leadbettera azotonutricia]AEF82085.1 tRNA pseudouridine synthase B [Leadbettera azotonutricia ZAS-9]
MPKASDRSGVLLLNKNPGLTSFESLFAVKRAFNTRKVGHTGTLDKFASGLLIVLIGKALKIAPWFSFCDKEYEAVIRFGVETATLDPEGEVVGKGPLPSREAVEKALENFRGEILQAPPLYSAIHVDGVRAHEIARSGRQVEMKKRPVTVYEIELSSWDPPLAGLKVRCSAGTYIRSLARDIALAAGSRGHLASLCRTRIGGFKLQDAANAENLNSALKPLSPTIFNALNMELFFVDISDVQNIIHGKVFSQVFGLYKKYLDLPAAGDDRQPPEGRPFIPNVSAVFYNDESYNDELAAIIECKDGKWKYNRVFAADKGCNIPD